MKKVASLITAGALLLGTYSVAFAGWWGVSQFSFTSSKTGAYSVSGENKQTGSGVQMMTTGGSVSSSKSITAGNVNVGGHKVTQMSGTSSVTEAGSTSGGNMQMSFGHSFQAMKTGGSVAQSGSITVSNVNVDLH